MLLRVRNVQRLTNTPILNGARDVSVKFGQPLCLGVQMRRSRKKWSAFQRAQARANRGVHLSKSVIYLF